MGVETEIDIIELDSVERFLTELSPWNGQWRPEANDGYSWIYRGQWNSTWRLYPRAFRPDPEPLMEAAKARIRPAIDEIFERRRKQCLDSDESARRFLESVAAELELIEQFRQLAESTGHSLSEWWSLTGREWLDAGGGLGHAPDDRMSDPDHLTAIAQHHGIPTRALDWTRSPLIAAFFASVVPTSGPGDSRSIAVWALSTRCIGPRQAHFGVPRGLLEVWCPQGKAEFLRAQDGTLIFDSHANNFFRVKGRWPCIEEAVEVGSDGKPWHQPVLRKFTLDVRKAEELASALRAARISHAHLMPTLDNVTRTLRDTYSFGGVRLAEVKSPLSP